MTQHASRIQSKYWKRIPKITQTAAVPLTNNDKWMQYAELLLGIKRGGKGYHYKKHLVRCFKADVRLTPCIKIKKSVGERVRAVSMNAFESECAKERESGT